MLNSHISSSPKSSPWSHRATQKEKNKKNKKLSTSNIKGGQCTKTIMIILFRGGQDTTKFRLGEKKKWKKVGQAKQSHESTSPEKRSSEHAQGGDKEEPKTIWYHSYKNELGKRGLPLAYSWYYRSGVRLGHGQYKYYKQEPEAASLIPYTGVYQAVDNAMISKYWHLSLPLPYIKSCVYRPKGGGWPGLASTPLKLRWNSVEK